MEDQVKRETFKFIRDDIKEIKKDIKDLIKITSQLQAKASLWDALGGKDLIKITSQLQVKSSLWGAIGGTVPFILGIILWLFSAKK